MNALPTQTHCPRCQADQPAYQMMGTQPSFCLECRFPLMYIAGKYPLQQILSQGGQSTVYLGRHHQLKRKAERVIKVLSQEHLTTSQAIKRFHREVQVTAELSQLNDHIVRIYDDFGEVPYLGYFYVMEYLQGALLSDYLQQNPEPLAPIWAIDLMLQLCEAIQIAHDNGVIHRDIKPQNLMVLERPSSPLFLKVIDWGIAKAHNEGAITQALTQQAIGTPLYMAPEQVFNDTIDERTDIYAMGVLFYELLTGSNPFTTQLQLSPDQSLSDTSMAQAINAQLNHTPPPLQDWLGHSQATEILQQITSIAIAKEPAQRYPNVGALQRALQQAASMLHYQVSSDQMPEIQLAQSDFGLDQPVRTPHSLDFIDASLRTKALPTGESDKEGPSFQPLSQLHSLSSYPEQHQRNAGTSLESTDDDQASASSDMPARTRPLPTPSETIYTPTIPGVATQEHCDDPSDEDKPPVRIQLSATNSPTGRETLSAVEQAYPKRLPLLLWFCSTLGIGMIAGFLWWSQFPENPKPNTGKRPPASAPRSPKLTAQGTTAPQTTRTDNHSGDNPQEIPPPTSRPTQLLGLSQPLGTPPATAQKLSARPPPIAKRKLAERLSPKKGRRLARRKALRKQRKQRKERKGRKGRKGRKRRQALIRSRPQPRQTLATNACRKGWRWVHIRPFLGHRSEVITEGGTSQQRSPDGLCISSSTRLMSIMQQGYALCIFSPRKQRDPLQLQLKPESGLHSPNYCVHRP